MPPLGLSALQRERGSRAESRIMGIDHIYTYIYREREIAENGWRGVGLSAIDRESRDWVMGISLEGDS